IPRRHREVPDDAARRPMKRDEMQIRQDDLQGPEIIALLDQHVQTMKRISPPESVHALDLGGLRRAQGTFSTVWDGNALAGCGALKKLDRRHAEIKSMRTSDSHRRQGVASTLLRHIIDEATRRGYRRLSLETGSMDYFEPARQLYARFGF